MAYSKILVGYDGSPGAEQALRQAVSLGKKLGAQVSALWVRDPLPHYAAMIDEVADEKDAADAFMRKLQTRLRTLARQENLDNIEFVSRTGHAAQEIVRHAEDGSFDLIVLGHSGHSALWGRLLGHTADRISEHATCSVLIVRQK